MHVIQGGRDPTGKRKGMSVTVTYWFADAETDQGKLERLKAFCDALTFVSLAVKPTWFRFCASDVPASFVEQLEAATVCKSRPKLEIVR